MQPSDIGGIVGTGQPRVSPDGSLIAFVVSRADVEANRYRSQVWLAPADGSSAPQPLTAGEHGDANPCWSPDSRRLACSAARDDTWDLDLCVDLYVVGADGGPPRRITDTTGVVLLPAWSPDGDRLAFCGVVDPFHDPQNFHLGVVEVA